MIIGNRFELGKLLGQGGMGSVHQAVDRTSGLAVAVKRLKPELASDADLLARFAREAEALRLLNHPNIVKVLATLEEDSQHYIVMEYVGRGSLDNLLHDQPRLSVTRVLEIALDLSDALTRAHRLNIIHRDLKPANVLLADDGTPRLTDFGVARFGARQRVTETGMTVGTLDYLSPEALNGEEVDARTDIWAFGVILYELLVGERPFEGSSPANVITAILTRPTPDLETLRPDAPVALVDLVYRMLEKNRAQRTPSVRQVGAELEAIIQGNSAASELSRTQIGSRDKPPITPTPTPESLKNNLPAQVTAFVGREKELDAVTALFDEPDIRAVTILGPGGMGKTRLALEIARRYVDRALHLQGDLEDKVVFPNGIYFVALAPITSPEFIIQTIAEAVRFSFYEADHLARQLLDYLREKQMLLVLDNFEHVIGGAPLVADILKAAPGIKILVTSRERLNLTAETLFPIGGMDFSDWDTPEDALRYSAAKLFVQAARRAKPGFELAGNTLPDLAKICGLVGGMPLGIELAAAWADTLGLDEIAAEIGHSLEFLETDMHDVPERHRSIRAVFEYSWAILSEPERDVFTRLAVFRGGFTRDAAIAVAGASLRSLTALVNKSLLSRDTGGRYQIHELLRQFAEERLAESGQASAVDEAHCAYYAHFLEALIPDVSAVAQSKPFKQVDAELDNVRAAWRWAIDHAAVSHLRSLTLPLHMFYQVRALYLEASDVFGKTLQAVNKLEASAEVNGLLVEILIAQGWILIRIGEIEKARTILSRGSDLLPLAPTPIGHLEPFSPMALVNSIQGDYQTALRLAQQALDFCLSRNDRLSTILPYYVLTSAAYGQGDYQAAERYSQQGLAIAEKSAMWFAAYFHVDLGNIARIMGNYAAAKQHYQACYAIRNEFNDPEGMAVSLKNLGHVAQLEHDLPKARELYEKSIVFYKDLGDRGGLATALAGLGAAETELGDFSAARAHLAQALLITQDLRLTPLMLASVFGFAQLMLCNGQRERGLKLLRFVVNHPSTSHEVKNEANALLARPENANTVALERGAGLELELVVHELLAL